MVEKITDNDTVIEKALDIADELNLLNKKGEWKNNKARNKAYSEVYKRYDVEVV